MGRGIRTARAQQRRRPPPPPYTEQISSKNDSSSADQPPSGPTRNATRSFPRSARSTQRSEDFKPWTVGRTLDLSDLDPGAEPFSGSSHERDDARLDELAIEVDRLQDLLYANGSAGSPHKLLLVLQGMDTSGKDGTARAVFSRCSPLGVRVAAFKAPTEVERAHDVLWRVHAVVPRAGEIAVFNRSHYEDVLVPFVEGWIDAAERDRRQAHINAFARLLTESGTRVLKCYLHISKEEQRQRFLERLTNTEKHWKFSEADLAERDHWKSYRKAFDDAISATSTKRAPWHIVPADRKYVARAFVADVITTSIQTLGLEYPKVDDAGMARLAAAREKLEKEADVDETAS